MRFKTLFNLREILGKAGFDDVEKFKDSSVHAIQPSQFLYDVLSEYIGASISSFPFIEESDLNQISKDLVDFITARFADWYCVESKDENLSSQLCYKWLDKFITILLETYDRYSTLLNFYNLEKANLMNPLTETEAIEAGSSMESESRFNDTPQNSQAQTSFNDDEHSTNQGYAKNTGTSGAETTRHKDNVYTIEKLDRINRLYRNLLLDWSDAFRSLFIGGEYEAY